MPYRIRRVDNTDEEVVHDINVMDALCFGDTAPRIAEEDFDTGYWWMVYLHGQKEPVGFAGLKRSSQFDNVGYLCRVGVLPLHRGRGLQHRCIRVREMQAKRNGWCCCVTDTTDNPASANSLIKAGYRLYTPSVPWAMATSLYWRRWLNNGSR